MVKGHCFKNYDTSQKTALRVDDKQVESTRDGQSTIPLLVNHVR
jgi:hypothetical protein